MKEILVIGSSNTDMVVKTDVLPLPGETKLGGKFFMMPGGKGANQAVTISRLGGNLTFVTKVGKDIFGKQTVDSLKQEGMNTEFVFVDEVAPSGTALIMVNAEGENCIVVAPGANANLTPEDLRKVLSIDDAEFFLLQLEIPMETISEVIRLAKKNSQKVILNPAPAQKLPDAILDDLYMITPNESEASFLTGVPVTDEESASLAARVLVEKGIRNVVITMGASGALIHTDGISKMITAKPVKAIDTTAAGDVFNGALVAALSKGIDLENSVAFANKAAAISVTRMGAQPSIPYLDEMDSEIFITKTIST